MKSIKKLWRQAKKKSKSRSHILAAAHPKYVNFRNHAGFFMWRVLGTMIGWGFGVLLPYDYVTKAMLPSEYKFFMSSPKGLSKAQIKVIAEEQYIDRYKIIFFTVLAALCAFATILYLFFNRKRWSYSRFVKKHHK